MKTLLGILMVMVPSIFLDLSEDIALAIRSGNANSVSAYFADKVDMKVLDQENIYSKAQAESILKDFFTKHPVKAFTVVHKSAERNDSQFAIGKLTTANGIYRVHFLMKKSGGSASIHQFRIETSDE